MLILSDMEDTVNPFSTVQRDLPDHMAKLRNLDNCLHRNNFCFLGFPEDL